MKNPPRKHNEHLSQFFFDHEKSSKDLNSIKNEKEILNVISESTIVHQTVIVAETQSNASRDRNTSHTFLLDINRLLNSTLKTR